MTKSRFPTILPKIEIPRKFWPKSRFFENFDQNRDFPKLWHKTRFCENLHQYRTFRKLSKLVPKIEIFRKYWAISRFSEFFFYQNRGFPKISTKMEIFENFDQNRYFQNNLTRIKFSKIVTKIGNFREIWPKPKFLKFFEIFRNFDQKQDFQKFRPKSNCC